MAGAAGAAVWAPSAGFAVNAGAEGRTIADAGWAGDPGDATSTAGEVGMGAACEGEVVAMAGVRGMGGGGSVGCGAWGSAG